jgi:flagella basal body P-ring formation protein FlgA
MSGFDIRRRLGGAVASSALALALLWGGGAKAQESTLPTPSVVIYPGDIIQNDMLTNAPADEVQGVVGTVVETRSELIGKRAIRTLLPGRAILAIAVGNPRAVVNGAEVTLVYSEGDLRIVAVASALQDGGVGDVIKVRNIDSGLTISGTVQADGSVRVSGG